MLQVVERTAVGNGRDQRAKLQRGHGDALAEGAHAAHTALRGGQFGVGIDSKLFAGDVVAGQLAQAELVGVVLHALEAHLAAQRLKVGIDGVRQRRGQGEGVVAAQVDRRIARDQTFVERSQGNGEFDGRAWLGPAGERELLVHHREDSPVGGIDRQRRTVQIAQRLDGRGADNRIFAGGRVAQGDVRR